MGARHEGALVPTLGARELLRERGYGEIDVAYSDSSADLPLLLAATAPVVYGLPAYA